MCLMTGGHFVCLPWQHSILKKNNILNENSCKTTGAVWLSFDTNVAWVTAIQTAKIVVIIL